MGRMKYSLRQEDKDMGRTLARLHDIFLGNKLAVALVMDVHFISHVWDDLVDGDKPVSKATISEAFHRAIFNLNTNSVFRENAATLLPIMLTAVLNWHAANDLEASREPHALQVAHVCRCAAGDVALALAAILGGTNHAKQHAAELKMLMQQDSLEDYLADLERADHATA